jgi:hypothetical protein
MTGVNWSFAVTQIAMELMFNWNQGTLLHMIIDLVCVPSL